MSSNNVFDLVDAPATFQRLIEVILAGVARHRYMVHMNNV